MRIGFAGSAGHGARPSGTDGRPGVGVAAGEESQAAPGPEAGQVLPPAGSVRLGF
ncbi:MAG TPA: hypothetical protein VEL12_04630 [Candidatus Nitrosopolaris sp.]|nr:hypothetical protein [Candidatus Nitrosopolaris sp.]